MNRYESPLLDINHAFQKLLAAPEPAVLSSAHRSDPLMVWFLLGGKDVGKSTFLNALLGTEGARLSGESVEGTQHFFAYIHESAVPELEQRLQGLSIEVQFLPHTSPLHQHLCLIDSPDFDSRFERHVSQVKQILSSGATDGAVLLSSPEKYKNLQYWSAFQALSHTLSPRHILFVLTKADELKGYLEEAREDFTQTVSKRMPRDSAGERSPDPSARGGGVYLINSLERSIDFQALEHRLLRTLTEGDVQSAQHDNRRHARRIGADQIRQHYRADEIRTLLQAASDPVRVDAICEDAFPEPFFHAVASRLAENRQITSLLREKVWSRPGVSLAGLTALHSAFQWIGTLNPFRLRRPEETSFALDDHPDMDALTRWGDEGLEQRLIRSQREVLSGLLPETDEAVEPFLSSDRQVPDTLLQHLEDLVSQPAGRRLPFAVRWLVNLPVYLYVLFFLFLLLSPLFLLLKAWGVPHMPDFTGVLSLDNVKVAVMGFSGYYLMAVLFVVRKQREQARRETVSLAHRFILEMKALLRREVAIPLSRFQEAFSRLEEKLEHAVLSDG